MRRGAALRILRIFLLLAVACILLYAVACFLIIRGLVMALDGGSRGSWNPPEPKSRGLFVPWSCTFQRDHVPPVSPEADALFKEARRMKKEGDLTAFEEERMVALYAEAAEMGHWKAMNNLAGCYLYGKGVEQSHGEADRLFDKLVARDVGAGYYGKYMLLREEKYRHKAADLGMPHAQFELGMEYLYPEHRDKQGFHYLVCAARQGHAEANFRLGRYLDMMENPYKAVEYMYRGAALGHYMAAFYLGGVFDPTKFPERARAGGTMGFRGTKELSDFFYNLSKYLEKNKNTRTCDLLKTHPLPENVAMTREHSRALPSLLKDAFGGRWPDEIFEESAPDYMPPDE
jgi:hypothetical protein